MATTSVKRKRKAKSIEDDCSRLGNLPEVVLHHILSLLPTKDAVRTSLLSKNWRYRWTFVNNLSFNDLLLYSKKKRNTHKAMFVSFVQRVCLLVNSPTIENFHLSCCNEYYDPKDISFWIFAAMGRNVKIMKIHAPRVCSLLFPSLTNCCGSLAELELRMSCTIKFESSICFSNLKIMDLDSVTFKNVPATDVKVLFFRFDVLEVLRLVKCRWVNVTVIDINAPKLRSFSSGDDMSPLTYSLKSGGSQGTCDCLLKMCVPSLTNFECHGSSVAEVLLNGPSSIVDLCVDVPCQVFKSAKVQEATNRLLIEFSDIKSLTISSGIVKDDLPELNSLIQLTVTDGEVDDNLMALLRRAPVLESLTFAKSFYLCKEAVVRGKFPKCIESNLKVVKFQHYDRPYNVFGKTNCWLEWARLLLKKATVLEKMIINFQGYLTTKEIQKLLESPNCSTRASVVLQ